LQILYAIQHKHHENLQPPSNNNHAHTSNPCHYHHTLVERSELIHLLAA
jgi:hypothetical protein